MIADCNRYAAALAGAMLLAVPLAAAPLPRPPAFAMCGVCHKTDPAAAPGMGPNLWGVGGRKAGSFAGYGYSPALKAAGQPWTRDRLIAFIGNPRGTVPGTKMAYAGQADPKLAAVIADYLLSLK